MMTEVSEIPVAIEVTYTTSTYHCSNSDVVLTVVAEPIIQENVETRQNVENKNSVTLYKLLFTLFTPVMGALFFLGFFIYAAVAFSYLTTYGICFAFYFAGKSVYKCAKRVYKCAKSVYKGAKSLFKMMMRNV